MGMLDRLYRSSEKDIASGDAFIRRFFIALAPVGAAAASITIDDAPCPSDVVRLITSVGVRWTPGAAQFGVNANLNINDVPGAGVTIGAAIVLSPLNQVAAQVQDYTVGGLSLLEMQGEVFRFTAFFNAGVAANNATCFISGYEFPRGTLRR